VRWRCRCAQSARFCLPIISGTLLPLLCRVAARVHTMSAFMRPARGRLMHACRPSGITDAALLSYAPPTHSRLIQRLRAISRYATRSR